MFSFLPNGTRSSTSREILAQCAEKAPRRVLGEDGQGRGGGDREHVVGDFALVRRRPSRSGNNLSLSRTSRRSISRPTAVESDCSCLITDRTTKIGGLDGDVAARRFCCRPVAFDSRANISTR
jgi:hypothetical protein